MSFDDLRTKAFRAILSKAFKAMPRKIDEVFSSARWASFLDFMGDVNRLGMELQAKKNLALDQANTEAMVQLLHEAFVFPQETVLDNLRELGVSSWGDLTKAVLAVAIEVYAESHRGRTPLDDAKEFTRKFFTMDPANQEQVLEVVKAFGFPSPQHLEAVLHAVFAAELTPEDLDSALEHPGLIEELVNRAPSNPHKGIKFWDREKKGDSMGAKKKTRLAGPKQWFSVRAFLLDPVTGMREPFISDVAASDEAEAAEAFIRMYPGAVITDVVPSRATPRGKLLVAGSSLGGPKRWYTVSALWPDPARGEWQPFVEEVAAENEAAAVETILRKYPDAHIEDVAPSGRAARGKLLVAGASLGSKMSRSMPHVLARDLDMIVSQPGNLVAVRWADWNSGKPVIEGWRGPERDSEDFARSRLELAPECQGATIMIDLGGNWECFPPGIKVY